MNFIHDVNNLAPEQALHASIKRHETFDAMSYLIYGEVEGSKQATED